MADATRKVVEGVKDTVNKTVEGVKDFFGGLFGGGKKKEIPSTKTDIISGVEVTTHGKTLVGNVDLTKTIERIKNGGKYPHKNDGLTFYNLPPKGKEAPLLPVKPEGYYKEYVHPTPGVEHAGLQRLIVGKMGKCIIRPTIIKVLLK